MLNDIERRLLGNLIDFLTSASEYLDDHADVIDGDYGEPRPNRAMSLHGDCERLLERLMPLWREKS